MGALIVILLLFLQFTNYLSVISTGSTSVPQKRTVGSSIFAPDKKSTRKAFSASSTEMIIITNDTSAVQDFANFKISRGVRVFVASMDEIKVNFTGTIPERIHAFLKNAYLSWPNLTYVLLAGDDYHIPMMKVYLPDLTEGWGFSNTYKPTDLYYACLDDDNWDDDADGIFGECSQFNVGGVPIGGPDEIDDWEPDIYLGRIPFSSYSQIKTFLEFIINYELDPQGQLQSSDWSNFLTAGATFNYDEQVNWWENGDFTDGAETIDYLIANDLPSSYSYRNFFENRTYFWDYSPVSSYQDLTRSNILSAMGTYDPSFIHFSAHGSPLGVYRNIDPSGYPYGERKLVSTQPSRITGIKIADADNLDSDNEIVAVTQAGSVIVYQGSWEEGWSGTTIANLPTNTTCVDVGDCDNDGANEIAVGSGSAVYVYEYRSGIGWMLLDNTLENPTPGNITCIYIGPTEENEDDDNYLNEIVVGDDTGVVSLYVWQLVTPLNFDYYPIYLNVGGDPHPFKTITCITANDVDSDNRREVIFGAESILPPSGVFALQGNVIVPHPGVSWGLSDVWFTDPDIPMSIDTGDADNDLNLEIAIGTLKGKVLMLENWSFIITPNPLAAVVTVDPLAGATVEGIAIGDVDENIPTNEIIAGTSVGVLRKYIAATNGSSYVLDQKMNLLGVDSLAIGNLDDNSDSTHLEIVVGTQGMVAQQSIFAYQWPVPYDFNFFYNTSDTLFIKAQIPALTFVESCSTAAFDYAFGDSFAEALMRSGKSIAYIGSLRATWYYYGPMNISVAPGNKGGNRAAAHLFWANFFGSSSDFRAGKAFGKMLSQYVSSYDENIAGYQDDVEHRKNVLSYIFLGDPELAIYTQTPQVFTIDLPQEILLNDILTVHVSDHTGAIVSNATVCIQGENFYAVLKTDQNGDVQLELQEGSFVAGEELTITVSKQNFVTQQVEVRVLGLNNVILVSTPSITFNSIQRTVSIISVVAYCNNSKHGFLNDTNALSAFYEVKTKEGEPTGLTGNLTFNGVTWMALDIPLLSLSAGDYYLSCTFRDIDAQGTSAPSKTFSIRNFAYWFKDNWSYITIGLEGLLIIILIIVVIVVKRKSR